MTLLPRARCALPHQKPLTSSGGEGHVVYLVLKGTTMTNNTWLLAKDAAEYLQIHPDTLRDLFRRREIKAVKIGNTWRTRTQWLDEFLLGGAA